MTFHFESDNTFFSDTLIRQIDSVSELSTNSNETVFSFRLVQVGEVQQHMNFSIADYITTQGQLSKYKD